MQKIMPCLWLDDAAEEAANFYVSIFSIPRPKASRATATRCRHLGTAEGDGDDGEIPARRAGFVALNGGPVFEFSPAISLIVNCETQREIDELWAKLSAGGSTGPCGWLKDKYGVSWQIVPSTIGAMLQDGEARKSEKVMRAVLTMNKIDLRALERAYRS